MPILTCAFGPIILQHLLGKLSHWTYLVIQRLHRTSCGAASAHQASQTTMYSWTRKMGKRKPSELGERVSLTWRNHADNESIIQPGPLALALLPRCLGGSLHLSLARGWLMAHDSWHMPPCLVAVQHSIAVATRLERATARECPWPPVLKSAHNL